MRFDLDALPQVGGQAVSDGTPLQLPVGDIDEDPTQPRQEFETEPLQQLADSISQHGLLQAISVRRHPADPQRWMVNFGARRLRACKLLGLTSIAATVNETAGSYAQVIENEQREGLKPLELALFVQSRMALGESQAEIARQLGKSAPYVTYATALIDAPDWLMTLYREGRCRGLRELHELRQLERQHPGCVRRLAAHSGAITREVVASLKSAGGGGEQPAKAAKVGPTERVASIEPARSPAACEEPLRSPRASAPAASDPKHECVSRSLSLWAELDGATVEVVVDAAPAEDGWIFVRTAAGEPSQSVDAASLRLLRIVARSPDH